MNVSLGAEAGRRSLAAVEIEERRDAEMERMSAVPPTASMMTSSVPMRYNQGAGLVTSPTIGMTRDKNGHDKFTDLKGDICSLSSADSCLAFASERV
jgi:hypothetical protein